MLAKMWSKCPKCGGYIPDLRFGGVNIHDCKNHIKSDIPFKSMILTKEEVELIKRKRKEEADYNKMMSEKPTVYAGKSKGRIKLLRKQLPKPQKCSRCPNPLFDSMLSSNAEPYKIGNELVCRECYFNDLGELVEKYPIGGLRKR